MIQALVFDLDGTLANTEKLHFKAWRKALLQNGVAEFTFEEFLRYVGTSNEKVANDYRESDGIQKSQNELVREKQTIYMELIPEVELCRGAQDIVDRFRGQMRLAVASSSHEKEVRAILEITGLLPHFSVVLGGDMVQNKKPDPEIYLKAQGVLGVSGMRSVAFEDSGPGLTAAKKAGMKTIAIPNEFTKAHDFTQADAIVESFDAVDDALIGSL
ncbi:HAD family hydrolase [Desulforhopalus sp. 52FAK]